MKCKAWHGKWKARHGNEHGWHGMVRKRMAWHDMAWNDKAWHGMS
jgi:hypothetical protein